MFKQSVVYTDDGVTFPASVATTVSQLQRAGVAWLDFVNPDALELEQLQAAFDLHNLAIQDVIHGQQRPKTQEYGQVRFIALRPVRIIEHRLCSCAMYVFIGPNFVVTIRDANFPDLSGIRHRVEESPYQSVTSHQILYLIFDAVIRSYHSVMEFVRDAVDEAEGDIIVGRDAAPHRVYELLTDVMTLQRSAHPVADIVAELREETAGAADIGLRHVEDRAVRLSGQADGFRDVLTAGLQLYTALLGQRQNEQMARMSQAAYDQGEQAKKVSAWAAILFAPTVLAGIYGMNFHAMPGLTAWYGFTAALLAMLASSVTLYLVFKHQRWL